MAKNIKTNKKIKAKIQSKDDLMEVKEKLEKIGEAVGDLLGGLFKSVGKILDVAQEMEKKGQKEYFYRKEIKGVTKSGKKFQGEAAWRAGTVEDFIRKHPKNIQEPEKK